MFIDQAKIFVAAGKGGDGASSFRREKFVPFGGPDGGDGGNGGNVVMTASSRITTLLDLKYQRHYEAQAGQPGQGSNCHGRSGSHTVIHVPAGTLVRDEKTDRLLADFTHNGQSTIIAHGGRGGKGNARFVSSTNRAPRQYETGTPGESLYLKLELKLLADVGLVGFPNAGKSTFISSVSAARPEVGAYPFTTLRPYLGVVAQEDYSSFVIADIPGLIQGAHEGKGLGLQFLRHIQRTAILLYLIDGSEWATEDPTVSFKILRHELAEFDPILLQRPFAIVGTKFDIQGNGKNFQTLQSFCEEERIPYFSVSAVTRKGLEQLLQFVGQHVEKGRSACASNG